MLSILRVHRVAFTRLTSKLPKSSKKSKEVTKKEVVADEKMIKLTKKEVMSESELRLENMRKQNLSLAPTHDKKLEAELKGKAVDDYKEFLRNTTFKLVDDPLFSFNKMKESIEKNIPDSVERFEKQDAKNREKFSKMSITDLEGKSWKEIKRSQEYMNCDRYVDEKFEIKKRENVHPMSRRSGLLAYKVGMISTFDKWGHLVPLTVLQVDRCQVLRIKTAEKEGYSAIQLGCGQRSLNAVKNHEIGQFLKADVPPKLDIAEFDIDEDNILPVGYMIGVRHFTVGQFVDVQAESKGKGFQGVMKRYGFAGQPATHGNSLAHRHGGSIGANQDPGRVWKHRKMPGRMGGDMITVRKLQVYKIDHTRSLIYVKGAVPGAPGRLVKVFDSFFHWERNKGMLNYPTFVYEQGKMYANIEEVASVKDDPTEVWLHDNVVPSDDEEEAAPTSDIPDE